jgi:hypothetical protein
VDRNWTDALSVNLLRNVGVGDGHVRLAGASEKLAFTGAP